MKTKKPPYDAVLNIRIDSTTLNKLKQANIDVPAVVRTYLLKVARGV
jgi:hypothetical protein